MSEEILTLEPKIPSRYESYKMFNRIAVRYDFLNHFLSAGQDYRWRKKAVKLLKNVPNQKILDLACGTGDIALTALKHNPNVDFCIGIDPAIDMLAIGEEKNRERNLEGRFELIQGDGAKIPIASNSLDAVLMAFGIRNVENFEKCLLEMYRVLKPGGRVIILEFSLPENFMIKILYLFYFRYILPHLGGFISGDKSAYKYLNRTVETFSYGEAFCEKLEEVDFTHIHMSKLSFGISTIYVGDK